jgi:hypothetical protein
VITTIYYYLLFQLPKTLQEWLTIAKGFEELWNFPHCLGALDGKHIVIQSPFNSGSEYYNYKTSFSVVLMAAVDANYCFIYAEVGCQGRISDGGVFKHTVLYDKLEREHLEIPLDAPLIIDHERTLLPFLFVADDAFPLRRNIMKPYPGVHSKGSTQRIFNYRLSRARRIVENAFGILASVFRVFRKPMLLQPNKVSIITMTCILLHNFLRRSKTSSTRYTPQGTLDVEIEGRAIPGSWREDQTEMSSFLPLTRIARKPSMEAKTIRDKFAEYFNTSGKIEWQDKYC